MRRPLNDVPPFAPYVVAGERENTSGSVPGTSRDVVSFNVGGRLFEIQPHIVRSRGPSTLLASLLDDIGTDGSRTIFVEANPERFPYILDWYRHGEMYLPADCSVDGVLRDSRFFLLPDVVKINGETHTVRQPVALEIHDMMRQTVISKWPSFSGYCQRLIGDLRRAAEELAEKSNEVDTDMFESPWDCGSDNASSHPQHSQTTHWATRNSPASVNFEEISRMPDRKMIIAKEFVMAEMLRVHEVDSDQLEVQSMAPMFMFNETPPAARWRWVDEHNVCNELRLRVLKAELERLGLNCTIVWPRSGEHELKKRLALRLDLSMPWPL